MSNDLWKAFMVATAAACGGRPRFDMGKARHRDAWNGLQALYAWIVRTVELSGVSQVAGRLKEFASNCRLCAIERRPVPRSRFHRAFAGPLFAVRRALEKGEDRTKTETDMVIQLSYISRALPKGRKDNEGRMALEAHLDALGSRADPLPEGRREELAKFAESWATQHLTAFSPHMEFDPTAGACLEFGRAKGGLARYLHEKMSEVVGDVPKYVKKLTTYPMAEDDVAIRYHAQLARLLAKELPSEEPPRAQAVVVCERGLKVRVVTKSPGALVALCHQARMWFAEGLRTDPAIKQVLAGDHELAVEAVLERGLNRNDLVVSSDLKSATDLIGRETYEALWEGIRRSKPGQTLPAAIVKAVSLAIGPQIIEYPAMGKFCLSKRGALMGLPTTWAFLCLSNLAWWTLAHPVAKGPKGPHRHVRKVAICGDDLLGAAAPEVVQKYEQFAVESGAKFSSAVKHIKTRRGGVFTENVFLMKEVDELATAPTTAPPKKGTASDTVHGQRARTKTVFDRWSQAFPIRGVLGTMRSDRTGREDPFWISLGPALEGLMTARNERWRKAILIALDAAHPTLKRFLKEHGLFHLWHVPRQFGGLGIPRPESLWNHSASGTRFHLRAAHALAAGSGWDQDLAVLARPYSAAPSTTQPVRRVAMEMSEAALKGRWLVARTEAVPPPGYFRFPGTVDDLLQRMEGNCSRDMFFLLSPEEPLAQRPQQLHGRIARRLARDVTRAQRRVVTTQGGWTCGKSVTLNWQDALNRLAAIEESRCALYNPSLVPKRWLMEFAAIERLHIEAGKIAQNLQERLSSHPAIAPSATRKKKEGRIPLLGSQVAQIRHDLARESSVLGRPVGLEAPFREWADRQTKRLVGEALGWSLGVE